MDTENWTEVPCQQKSKLEIAIYSSLSFSMIVSLFSPPSNIIESRICSTLEKKQGNLVMPKEGGFMKRRLWDRHEWKNFTIIMVFVSYHLLSWIVNKAINPLVSQLKNPFSLRCLPFSYLSLQSTLPPNLTWISSQSAISSAIISISIISTNLSFSCSLSLSLPDLSISRFNSCSSSLRLKDELTSWGSEYNEFHAEEEVKFSGVPLQPTSLDFFRKYMKVRNAYKLKQNKHILIFRQLLFSAEFSAFSSTLSENIHFVPTSIILLFKS